MADPENPDASSESEEDDTKGNLKPVKGKTFMEYVAGLVATTAVGTSLAAMVIVGGPFVIVAGILSCAIGPYAYYQQTKLTDIKALKETHEAMKKEVDRLNAQNAELKATVGELSDTVGRLEDVEQALDLITQTQGQSVAEFAEQIEENKKVLATMQKNLRANVLQNLLSVLLRTDTDGDNNIDDAEADQLIERINTINGVKVNTVKFKEAIFKSNGSISAVMEVIKNLLSDDGKGKDNDIFVIEN